jgi:Family of unknown function (DUF5906)
MVDPTPIRKDLFGSWTEPKSDNAAPNDNDLGDVSSLAETMAWYHKYYVHLTHKGAFFIINERIPDEISFMNKKNFLDSLEDKQLLITAENGTTKTVPTADIWLKNPSQDKRRCQRVVFDPSLPSGCTGTTYNLWRGFATEARQGDCHLTLEYIHDIIADKKDEISNLILDFLAHMRQKPWEKPEFGILLNGPKGVGKTFFLDLVNFLIDGKKRHLHCFKTANPEDIYGDHRAQLMNLMALLLEEVTWGGDRKHESTFKDILTGKTITLNIKYGPVITIANRMRVIMAANPGWNVPASYDERRYAVFTVPTTRQNDHAYFADIQKELDNGGYEALMYLLLHRDISKFNCREAPITEALIDQKTKSMSDVEKWWFNILRKGQIKFYETIDGKCICVARAILYEDYCQTMKKLGVKSKLLQEDEFGILLRTFLPKVENGKIVIGGRGRPESIIGKTRMTGPGTTTQKRPWVHIFPPLDKCRELWDFRIKGTSDWDEPVEWELPEYSAM